MSSIEQPVDPQLIEQTKRQIQSLVAEIAQLSRQTLTPVEFYGEFLTRVVSALAAIGGAVWTTNDDGQLALQFQINLQETRLRDRQEDQARHGRLLYKALGKSDGMLVPAQSGFGEGDEAANPTDFLVLLGPLKTDLETVGLVEIFQRSDTESNTQKGYLRFLLQMCELAADFLKSHQLRHFSDRQVLWAKLEDFARTVHTSLEPIATAYTIANEGRRLIECDRVSVAIRKGNMCKIEAVSGQDVFDKRSNTIRLLGKLASAVVATGDPVWYAGDSRDLAPQVEDAVQEYVDEAHSKMIAVLPLRRPRQDEEDDPKEREADEPTIGALIVEQIEDSRVAPALSQRVDVVCRHSATALANAMEHQNLFLMPLWRAIGKSRWLVQARTLPKTVSISVAVVVALIVMAVWPIDFNLHSKGTLEPINRRDVFASEKAVVTEVLVKHGDMVKAGQTLVRMRNTDFEVAKTDIEGQLIATGERINDIQRLLIDERQLRADERTRVSGELAELGEKLHSLEHQSELYKKKMEELEVKSPIAGEVVTWDLENRLIHRPVERGQVLLRVADPAGPWQLEVHMSEDRLGHIVKAQQELTEFKGQLPVTYISATEPGTSRKGTIMEIEKQANVHGEDGNIVLIRVAIDKDELPNRRPGAAVTAKVYCGRRSILYVCFHDLVAFVQSRILFRL
ncbi:MAG: biotin/lipoyl-binding protein [Thermoguttaceae bacterium]|jgi:hypothetical protein